MLELFFLELYQWGLLQTDPNFANYQYNASTGAIVLLDFGATRHFKASFGNNYKKLASAAIEGNRKKLVTCLVA